MFNNYPRGSLHTSHVNHSSNINADIEIQSARYQQLEAIFAEDTAIYSPQYLHRSHCMVPITDVAAISSDTITSLHSDYSRLGYAVFKLHQGATPESLVAFAVNTGLGMPFQQGNGNDSMFPYTGAITLIPALNEDGSLQHHLFGGKTNQELHVDGALQEPAGLIATSILCCITPARSGGENIIFNGVAALHHMYRTEPTLARALLHPKALTRKLDGIDWSVTEGVFVPTIEGEIMSRFAIDTTVDWDAGFSSVANLREAYSNYKK